MDFDQIDDLDIRSEYIASLTYFDLFASDFLDDNLDELTQLEDFIIPQLRPDNVENVLKLEFTFEFSNSMSRDFIANVVFYDENGLVNYQLETTIDVLANTQNVRTVITVLPPDIEAIFNAQRAAFQLQLVSDPNNPLLLDSSGVLGLKSSLKIFLSIKK